MDLITYVVPARGLSKAGGAAMPSSPGPIFNLTGDIPTYFSFLIIYQKEIYHV
jgi:hypothetical protein